MTAYPIGVEVSCDGPDEQTDCPESAAIRASFESRTARQVRADGRADGWTTQRRSGHLRDVCPGCRAAETQDAPRERHPTEADLRHALAVAAKFHGQNADAPAAVSAVPPQPEETA